MIFKLKQGQKPGTVITSGEMLVGKFNERGYVEITDDLYIAKMKRAGYEEVTLRYCECGEPFEGQGEYMTHCKTCPAHKAAKIDETPEAPKRGRKKNDSK